MASVFPSPGETPETASQIAAAFALLAGVAMAWPYARRHARTLLERLWAAGWGFDWLYDRLFVRPITWFAKANRLDAIDFVYRGLAVLTAFGHRTFALTQTGKLRWYAAAIAGGSILFLAVVMFS